MDKGCLILVARSDLLRPRGQVFDRFEISHFLPLPRYKMQVKGFNFFMLSPANMGNFFLEFALFSLTKTQILAPEGMMNV